MATKDRFERFELHFGFNTESHPIARFPYGSLHPLQDMLVGFEKGKKGDEGQPAWHSRIFGNTLKLFLVDLREEEPKKDPGESGEAASGLEAEGFEFYIDFLPSDPQRPFPGPGTAWPNAEEWPFNEPDFKTHKVIKFRFLEPPKDTFASFRGNLDKTYLLGLEVENKVTGASTIIEEFTFKRAAPGTRTEMAAMVGNTRTSQAFVRDPEWEYDGGGFTKHPS